MKTYSVLVELGEMLPKFQQTANRSLRKTYARRAKELLAEAEKNVDKGNPEAWAGFRSLRNQWIQVLDYQFPELQRPELAGTSETGLGNFSLGIIENTFVTCNWYMVAGVCGLLYFLGRAHQKAMRKKRARMARMKRMRAKKKK